jgi:mandelamide amidase
MDESTANLSIEAVVDGIRRGVISAEAYVRYYLDRHATDAGLLAITHFDRDQVIEQAFSIDRAVKSGLAVGGLAGVPYVAKDNIDAIPFPTTAGTPSLSERRPSANAHIVAQLADEGAVLFGKANMHELAMGNTTSNPTYGATKNPLARRHVPGGSSGGSAAAVGAGVVPLALGTDTAASVRMPAACCGVAGFRPTVLDRNRRRYSTSGVIPASFDIDTIGPIARSAADLDYFDQVICRRPARMAPAPEMIRLGIPEEYFFSLGPGVGPVIQHQLARLADAGITLVPISVASYAEEAARGFFTMLAGAISTDCVEHFGADEWAKVTAGVVSADVAWLLDSLHKDQPLQSTLDAAKHHDRDRVRSNYQAVMRDNRLNAVAFPTLPILPPEIAPAGDKADRMVTVEGRQESLLTAMIRNTVVGSYLGAPGLSLPAGTWHGLPVGLEFDANCGDDENLLALGRVIESIIDGHAAFGVSSS